MKTHPINQLYMSEHLKNERADRVVNILMTVGLGEIKWSVDSELNDDVIYKISTTGVLFVVSKKSSMVMTAYIINREKVSAIFHGKTPDELWKIVKKNEKKGLTHNWQCAIIKPSKGSANAPQYRKEMKTMKKMVMTEKLANELMDVLACVALSATGGVDPDNINEEQMKYAEEYARDTFGELLGAWEELTGKEWDIEA